METQYVNGFAYNTMRPAPDEEIPQRFARAEEVWERKVWREQLREWDETFKPAAIKTHRELQAVDADALSDDELVAYLTRCREHHSQMIFQHMRFTGSAMLPVGDLLAHLGAWTDVAPADALAMLRGAAPVSAGASGELERLIAAITHDTGRPRAPRLRRRPRQDARGAARVRRRRRRRDVGVSRPRRLPAARRLRHLRALRARAARRAAALDPVVGRRRGQRHRPTSTRASPTSARRCPTSTAREFDELLGEARLMYRLRDERGVFSDIWASGIMRRAVLAAGRRLEDKGRVHDAEHFVDAGFDEMCALVTGTGGPSADELAQRFADRSSRTAKDAPPSLGPPPPPPPDPSGLPPGVARVMHAVGIAMGELFGSSEAPHEENLLRGLAASGGVYEGPARRVSGPSEFDRIVQGDVLVTESTTEAFNILLPLLGAIVTDAGGLLSHSAIVAREYGIPGVVGTRDATDRIPDGTRVRVDGDAGEVTVYT